MSDIISVLVVDDSAYNRQTFKDILEKGDLEIVDIFRNDFGDELVLEGPYPKHKRVYLKWDLDE